MDLYSGKELLLNSEAAILNEPRPSTVQRIQKNKQKVSKTKHVISQALVGTKQNTNIVEGTVTAEVEVGASTVVLGHNHHNDDGRCFS